MIKYSYKNNPAIENYWEYCCKHEIPHIEISIIDEDYAIISYDLLPCLPFEKLKSGLTDSITKLYEAYADFFKLPAEKFTLAGGSIALGITVYTKHCEFISEQLFDYLADYVANNKYSV